MKWLIRLIIIMATLALPTLSQAQARNITITWAAPVVDSAHGTPTGYNIYGGTSSGGESLLAGGQPVTSTSFVFTGGTPGVTYYFYVTAQNASGEGPKGSEVSATFLGQSAPGAPVNTKAVAN